MSLQDFTIIKQLGKGAFSQVYKVQRKQDKKIYALKRVFMAKLNKRDQSNSLNEVRILSSIKHKNIISYKQSFYDPPSNSLCIIMEYADSGDLSTKIKDYRTSNKNFSESTIWNYSIQMIQGLKALHDNKIIHRDIKSANIFLMKNGMCKLGDLNVSKVTTKDIALTQTGTPYYASPEVWNEKPYGYKSDLWSIGCVVYELCMLRPPFFGKNMEDLYKCVCKGRYMDIDRRMYSEDLSKFIRMMIEVDCNKRMNCDQILKSDVVKRHMDGVICEGGMDDEDSGNVKMMGTIKINDINEIGRKLPKEANYEEDKDKDKEKEKEKDKDKDKCINCNNNCLSNINIGNCNEGNCAKVGGNNIFHFKQIANEFKFIGKVKKARINLGNLSRHKKDHRGYSNNSSNNNSNINDLSNVRNMSNVHNENYLLNEVNKKLNNINNDNENSKNDKEVIEKKPIYLKINNILNTNNNNNNCNQNNNNLQTENKNRNPIKKNNYININSYSVSPDQIKESSTNNKINLQNNLYKKINLRINTNSNNINNVNSVNKINNDKKVNGNLLYNFSNNIVDINNISNIVKRNGKNENHNYNYNSNKEMLCISNRNINEGSNNKYKIELTDMSNNNSNNKTNILINNISTDIGLLNKNINYSKKYNYNYNINKKEAYKSLKENILNMDKKKLNKNDFTNINNESIINSKHNNNKSNNNNNNYINKYSHITSIGVIDLIDANNDKSNYKLYTSKKIIQSNHHNNLNNKSNNLSLNKEIQKNPNYITIQERHSAHENKKNNNLLFNNIVNKNTDLLSKDNKSTIISNNNYQIVKKVNYSNNIKQFSEYLNMKSDKYNSIQNNSSNIININYNNYLNGNKGSVNNNNENPKSKNINIKIMNPNQYPIEHDIINDNNIKKFESITETNESKKQIDPDKVLLTNPIMIKNVSPCRNIIYKNNLSSKNSNKYINKYNNNIKKGDMVNNFSEENNKN